jgi:NAD(P)-dependent dehydrogenase (short-subunit alcohol dehydrogenase family)
VPVIEASGLLRAGLLDGVSLVFAGPSPGSTSVPDACSELGARVFRLGLIGERSLDEEAALQEAVAAALEELGSVDLLVVDGAGLFTGDAGRALRTCLQSAWNATQAVANLAFLPSGRGGRILYLAPSPCAGGHTEAARAGLENLARTLSIEWARHGITAVAIAPGDDTSEGDLGALTSYLASPAGAYFSGCLLDLRGPAGR